MARRTHRRERRRFEFFFVASSAGERERARYVEATIGIVIENGGKRGTEGERTQGEGGRESEKERERRRKKQERERERIRTLARNTPNALTNR